METYFFVNFVRSSAVQVSATVTSMRFAAWNRSFEVSSWFFIEHHCIRVLVIDMSTSLRIVCLSASFFNTLFTVYSQVCIQWLSKKKVEVKELKKLTLLKSSSWKDGCNICNLLIRKIIIGTAVKKFFQSHNGNKFYWKIKHQLMMIKVTEIMTIRTQEKKGLKICWTNDLWENFTNNSWSLKIMK